MGFFDKVKNTFSQLTGGTGNIQMKLNTGQVARGESVEVTFTVYATGALKAKSANIELVGTERVKFQVPSASSMRSDSNWARTEERTKENQTYRRVETLDPNGIEMAEGESRQYSGTLQVPTGVQATYRGIDAQHVWTVRAFLDVQMGADIASETEITVT